MPANPDLVISQMKITVGDIEITGLIKAKEKAKEMFEDAVSRGHQAGLLQIKEEDEKVLQMTVGNIEPRQVVVVQITFIEQAKIFEGAYHINIPRGLVLLMAECSKENTSLTVDILCSSMIQSLFCPKFLTKTDLGHDKQKEIYRVSLVLLEGKLPDSCEDISIYF